MAFGDKAQTAAIYAIASVMMFKFLTEYVSFENKPWMYGLIAIVLYYFARDISKVIPNR